MLKQFKIITLAPTCFSSCRNHHQGAVMCLAKTMNMVFFCAHRYRCSQCYGGISTCCAILSAGSTETVMSTEAKDCQVLIRQLKAKLKQIVLQWIPGHSQIAGNEYANTLAKKGAKITQTHIRETSYNSIKLRLKQVFQSAYRQELGTKLFQKPWKQELTKYQIGQEEGQLQSFDCVSGLIAWEHIFIALEFVPTPTACCAASTKPQTETILDDVQHYPVGQSVSDTGRPGQK